MKEAPKVFLKPRKSPDQWIEERTKGRPAPAGDTKRVTVDLLIELHQKLKIKCVMERVNIADMVRGWIEEKLNERPPG
jgi:hypothetical protein